uniref:SWIM-type domain-containing protein n=1 Tax=Magallana gigas TaxID=29159 RepID=A0A8W8JKJ8_MAGGI|nr:zinc finger SWIM domain-containing protein 8 [Crassostrea gigas]
MDFMFDWENENDRFSFEDSERFEEDSLCSWISEPESLCNNWRGWKRQNGGQATNNKQQAGAVSSLVELASKAVACHIPFEVVEHFPQPIPEQLQLRIAFWSFPENEEDIRLYSCLANGSADEFQKGEHLYKTKSVKEVLQIGFHLSASVIPPQGLQQAKGNFNVAVVFDRRRISSCTCTCNSQPSWCSHVVALCLYRIHQATSVKLRAPVSESLSRLHRDQLQKFAQYLISELPQQILPTAQRLLDELLSSQENAMNTVCGAPDPTAGPSANEQTSWCLDESALHENVKKTLVKFCVPSPIVFSDVNYLSATAPPAAAEWQSLLRPLRGREPEGMWNLLSIVREMLRRNDSNAVRLLEIITDEVLQCEQILLWWFTTKVTNNNNNNIGRGNGGSGANATQHAASSLCDEIVTLWRLSALNPKLSPIQRDDLVVKFREWHISTIEKVKKARSSVNGASNTGMKKNDLENFVGFKPSIEACNLEWTDYPIPGVTYSEKEGSCIVQYIFNKHSEKDTKKPSRIQAMPVCFDTIISTDNKTTLAQAHCMLQDAQEYSNMRRNNNHASQRDSIMNDGAISSGSEGFCEPERSSSLFRGDSDSGSEMKEVNSRSNSLDGHDLRNYAPELISSSFGLERSNNGVLSRSGSNLDEVFDGAEGGADGMNIGMFGFEDGERQMIEEVNAQSHRAENMDVLHPLDDYQIYYFNNPKIPEPPKSKTEKSDEPNLFAGVKDLNSMQDILFSRAEALHAHGHTRDACRLAQKLAEELLSNPPDLLAETANLPSLKGKKKKVLTSISLLASSTLSKAAFLCSVLAEETECHHLAFKVGMFGLEMPRPPASSKALEVKLAYQESEILNLMKKIPLGPAELAVLREKAEELRDGSFKTRGDALLPLTLATFIFDSLCLPAFPVGSSSSRPPSRSVQITVRTSIDEKLGFDGAVAALGLKANVSEAEHPLLCESTRRQRGELAIAMLVHYKDDPIKLSKIMDRLLDKEVHQLYKAPSLVNYLGVKTSSSHASSTASGNAGTSPNPQACGGVAEPPGSSRAGSSAASGGASAQPAVLTASDVNPAPNRTAVGARPKITYPLRYNSGKDTDSSAVEEEDEVRALEAKLRCMAQKKKPSQGMASIDSSAPETTSSDNSPTLIRRTWSKHQGPGSDCGSSADSDSLGSSSSGEKDPRAKMRDNDSPPDMMPAPRPRSQPLCLESRSSTPNVKNTRFKGKSRMMPTVPNQPSEAIAHFMFELSKTVLGKAGGNSSTSLFTQPTNTNTTTGPHRNLHICAFQIGVYALGLNNCVSPNWLSRTYSSHVSWITGQAIDIGSIAINILIDTWEGHLTPPEVASLADKASRGRDPAMVRAAADLALSCLPHAQALNPSEVQRAIFQCKEQSRDMLERACLAVESAAKGGGVYPEVLFDVARQWFELSEEAAKTNEASNVSRNHSHQAELDSDNSNSSSLATERQSPLGLQVLPMSSSSNHQVSNQVVSHANPTLAQPMVLSYTIPPANHHQLPHQALVQHIGYVQQLSPFGQQFTQQHIPIHGHNVHHPYVTFPYQTQPPFNNLQLQQAPNVYSANPPQFRPLGTAVQVFPQHSHCQITPIQCPPSSSAGGAPQQPIHQAEALVEVSSNSPSPPQQGSTQGHHGPSHLDNETQLNYLMASFRVGMLALETLSRRVHDDRPQTKYARNPPYGEDVKWLLGIAVKLGINYLQQFCASAVNAVVSPFVLYDIAIEAAHVLARSNPVVVQNHMRSNILNPLIQKCLNMFNQCAHQKIHHINQSDYDDFVSTICSARNAFCLTPGGLVQFQELLQSLRRSKSCRKDLWTRILHALATGNV